VRTKAESNSGTGKGRIIRIALYTYQLCSFGPKLGLTRFTRQAGEAA